MNEATAIAQELGKFKTNEPWVEAEIARLNPEEKPKLYLDHVRGLHEWLNENRKAHQSCRLVGNSQTGKTFACKIYLQRMESKQEGRKVPTVPVLLITPDTNCGSKNLFEKILRGLNYGAIKGTVSDLRSRAMDVLKRCQVEMLIIDEADRIKPETFADVRDISDRLPISVVLVGTNRVDTVIKRDEQVYNRFRSIHHFGQLAGEEFKKTVAIWEVKVLKLPVPSNLTSQGMLTILTKGTEGYIGRLDNVLRKAATMALSRGFKKIDKAILQEAMNNHIK